MSSTSFALAAALQPFLCRGDKERILLWHRKCHFGGLQQGHNSVLTSTSRVSGEFLDTHDAARALVSLMSEDNSAVQIEMQGVWLFWSSAGQGIVCRTPRSFWNESQSPTSPMFAVEFRTNMHFRPVRMWGVCWFSTQPNGEDITTAQKQFPVRTRLQRDFGFRHKALAALKSNLASLFRSGEIHLRSLVPPFAPVGGQLAWHNKTGTAVHMSHSMTFDTTPT